MFLKMHLKTMTTTFRQQSHQSYKLKVLLNRKREKERAEKFDQKYSKNACVCIESIRKIPRLDFVSCVVYRDKKTRFHVLAKENNNLQIITR